MSSANAQTRSTTLFSITTTTLSVLGVLGIGFVVGCGGSDAPTAATSPAAATAQPTVAQTAVIPPTDVVSEFLDLVRRGGEDTGADRLLTKRAQAELARIGRDVQPIGSPDAKYQVTRAEQLPDDPAAALVHSIWSEPEVAGTKVEYQVVWAVQRESEGWRISGLAMEIDPSQEPTVINFEDGDQLALLLGAVETEAVSETASAQATTPTSDQVIR